MLILIGQWIRTFWGLIYFNKEFLNARFIFLISSVNKEIPKTFFLDLSPFFRKNTFSFKLDWTIFKLLDDNYNTRNMWQHQHSTSDISITRTSYVENLFCLSSLFLFYWTSTNPTRQKKIRGIHLCINWIKCACG